MYQVYLAKGRRLKQTLDAIQSALNTKSEAEALERLRRAGASEK